MSSLTGQGFMLRYVISERGDLFERRNQLFPKFKVWIVKHSETSGTFPANLPVCTAELVIRKPVGLETLWNLLQLPLKWRVNGARFQIPIQGISNVRIEKEGQITGPLDSPEEYLRFSNPCYRTDMDLVAVESTPESKQTIRHLSRLIQPSKFLCARRNDESDFGEGELAERVLVCELGTDDGVYYDLLPAVRHCLTETPPF
jgi:hypothetical protein